MKKLFASVALALGVFGLAPTALAVPIEWTLADVTFDDGGTASGSFVHEADTGVYSNVRIVTTAGSKGKAATIQAWCTTAACLRNPLETIFTSAVDQRDLTNAPYFNLELLTVLPNAPTTLNIENVASATCSDATCQGNWNDLRMGFTGTLVGAAYIAPPTSVNSVPTLNQWGLMLLASLLGGLTCWRQRRRS